MLVAVAFIAGAVVSLFARRSRTRPTDARSGGASQRHWAARRCVGQRRRRSSALLDQMDVGVLWLDPSLQVLRVNRAASRSSAGRLRPPAWALADGDLPRPSGGGDGASGCRPGLGDTRDHPARRRWAARPHPFSQGAWWRRDAVPGGRDRASPAAAHPVGVHRQPVARAADAAHDDPTADRDAHPGPGSTGGGRPATDA